MNESFFPTKEKFINPYTDEGFKRIFGSEINKDMIIKFLNSLLNETIRDITFRNVEAFGLGRNDRKAVFDIFCKTDKEEMIIVEMQKSSQKYFSDRVLYYASFAIQQQASYAKEQLEQELKELKEGQEAGCQTAQKRLRWNYAVNRVYVVCVLNYIMDRKYPDKYRWDIIRMDRELKVPFSDTLTEVYLEMPKFTLKLSDCDTLYKKFLFVLNNIDILERLPKELNEQIFQKLKSIVEIERMTPDERLAYELSLSTERDLYACMETKYEEGMEKGKAEGKVEGKVEVAGKMKSQGIPVETIAQCTGLSVEEIGSL
jgi:predicted transposase/invertase (TIGR01784 family)